MKAAITLPVDTAELSNLPPRRLAALWHAAQVNPAPIDDTDAARLVEHIGREIIARWLANTVPLVGERKGAHAFWYRPAGESSHVPEIEFLRSTTKGGAK